MDWRARYDEFGEEPQFVGLVIAMRNFLADVVREDGE
jgi:hypothetical protein